jgi:hypothetical protein
MAWKKKRLKHVCGNEFTVYLGGAINLIALMLSLPFNTRKFKGEKLRIFPLCCPTKKMGSRF